MKKSKPAKPAKKDYAQSALASVLRLTKSDSLTENKVVRGDFKQDKRKP